MIIDGAMGTELARQGFPVDEQPSWSAEAILEVPDLVSAIHRDYAAAGATLHIANTFRTTERAFGNGWRDLAATAVALAREAVPADHLVAGSIAPLEDCYRPDLSPDEPEEEHRRTAQHLASCDVDLLLCETFPHVEEALAAVRAAVSTGLPTWVSFTPGPGAPLLLPSMVRDASRRAIDQGAEVVLVNCVPAHQALPYVDALQGLGVPTGIYGNASDRSGRRASPREYAEHAALWRRVGADHIGGCCGTGPGHIRALAAV